MAGWVGNGGVDMMSSKRCWRRAQEQLCLLRENSVDIFVDA
jgi:hypothetical protein